MKMKTIVTTATATIFVICSTGCRSFTSPARHHTLKDNQVHFVDYDVTRRGTFIVPKGKDVKTISEPAPDAGIETVSKFLAKIDHKDIKGEASAEVAEKLVEFGKRTQTIMFLRETLFRLSEVGNNAGLKPEEYQQLYVKIVDAALALAKSEELSATEGAAKATARSAEAGAKLTEAEAVKLKAFTEKAHKLESLKTSNPDLYQKLLRAE